MKPSDKTWIIGASTGIGRALACELDKRCHTLALSARNKDKLESLNASLYSAQHEILPLDITDMEAVRDAAQKLHHRWQRIDRVIFMAGQYTPMRLGNLEMEEVRKILDTNLLGAFHVVESILPLMLPQKQGQIVLCGSVAGFIGLPKSEPYGATKSGIIHLAEALSAEHGEVLDIKLINPGFVKTRLTDKNDFDMPMRIPVEQAAKAIADGLDSKRFEIHFPKRFTYMMKLMKWMPYWLYFRLVR